MGHHHCARLGVTSFGFAVGIVWALGLLILGLFSWWTGWGRLMVSVISSVYVGYAPTFWGTIVGVIWGFIDGFISGVILAAIYNCCARKCKKGDVEGVETHV
ncbi:hypothetical protein AYM02_03975 [Coxiella burnetii]|uniref:bacteriophage holin n=1 Tax=Coxiella burnetii TaxID=777 RepID=UPI0000DAEB51|nr:bacteriophage holin [Coxiella burnetii]ABX78301.1 conserved hypothetical protein [Coxiella burnetii RSA 331]AML48510.1 hypothetical protein AUR58_04440 [Coxiella burnetii]AML54508.1 hypothetical protein AYM38_03935 [Coxiella burnetii]ATN68469.1 hypothetical protein AYM00_04120 [Coxiella burnetii]ATN70398.1 hypothetical protein AYM02_03975 [Coxiella burnetii]